LVKNPTTDSFLFFTPSPSHFSLVEAGPFLSHGGEREKGKPSPLRERVG
jgi:hypothetical protein